MRRALWSSSCPAYEWMTDNGFMGFANTVAAHLARAMLELDRHEEAEQWADHGSRARSRR